MTVYSNLFIKLFAFPKKMTKKQHREYASVLLSISKFESGKIKKERIASYKRHLKLGTVKKA